MAIAGVIEFVVIASVDVSPQLQQSMVHLYSWFVQDCPFAVSGFGTRTQVLKVDYIPDETCTTHSLRSFAPSVLLSLSFVLLVLQVFGC